MSKVLEGEMGKVIVYRFSETINITCDLVRSSSMYKEEEDMVLGSLLSSERQIYKQLQYKTECCYNNGMKY